MYAKLTAAALLLACAATASAADNACLLEGRLKIGKDVTELKDCMQNDGAKADQFLQTCKQIAELGAGMGAPPKVTYMNACPAAPQGVCSTVFGQKISAYYYKRTPDSLADAKKGCAMQGGKWRNS